MFVMVDRVREMTARKSCKCDKYESFMLVVFIFLRKEKRKKNTACVPPSKGGNDLRLT